MPKKGSDKRKGRRTRTLGNSNNSQQANSKASPPARGRSTNNSRHGRKPPPKQAPSRRPPNKAGKRRNPSHSPDQPIFFTSDSGELYKPGGQQAHDNNQLHNDVKFNVLYIYVDFAYVDSQRANLPYHICLIKNFKLVIIMIHNFSHLQLLNYTVASECPHSWLNYVSKNALINPFVVRTKCAQALLLWYANLVN